jgi:MFS family permease
VQIQSVAVGWQVYDITGDPFDLGLVGLAQFAPVILLVLVTGAAADRFDRRFVMALALAGQALSALALFVFAYIDILVIWPILLTLVGFGAARAFINPIQHAIVPNLVPPEHLGNAFAFVSAIARAATVAGPLAGGLLYGISGETAYATTLLVALASIALVAAIPATSQRIVVRSAGWREMVAGFSYIWKEKIVLGAISLDLFAVLLGGATALLPVYAADILEVGPWGLGLLRAAPGVGGILMAFYVAFHPVRDHAGLVLLASVALFGASTVVFGLSSVLWLSLVALVVMGASDVVSVYIRATLVQLWTPDQLRGRVSAVNTVFLNASNEVGAFRAGGSAALIGAIPAVVVGGIGAVAVAALWYKLFPELRRTRHLDGRT